MKDRWLALLHEVWQAQDFRDAIAEICDTQADSAVRQQGSYLSKGDMPNACIARGQALAWESLPKVLERLAKKGAPDNT